MVSIVQKFIVLKIEILCAMRIFNQLPSKLLFFEYKKNQKVLGNCSCFIFKMFLFFNKNIA
jgi:hypothetical protein